MPGAETGPGRQREVAKEDGAGNEVKGTTPATDSDTLGRFNDMGLLTGSLTPNFGAAERAEAAREAQPPAKKSALKILKLS